MCRSPGVSPDHCTCVCVCVKPPSVCMCVCVCVNVSVFSVRQYVSVYLGEPVCVVYLGTPRGVRVCECKYPYVHVLVYISGCLLVRPVST